MDVSNIPYTNLYHLSKTRTVNLGKNSFDPKETREPTENETSMVKVFSKEQWIKMSEG